MEEKEYKKLGESISVSDSQLNEMIDNGDYIMEDIKGSMYKFNPNGTYQDIILV